jgi:hypothetical protein
MLVRASKSFRKIEMNGDRAFKFGNYEPTVWDLYNTNARIRDQDMLKDWGYNIQGLLLFVRLNDFPDLILISPRI